MEKNTTAQREFQGEVVSAAMHKTIVVKIDHMKLHPKYKKQFRVSKRFKVHDELGQFTVGDVVRFVETRPMSKDKRWRVIGKV